MSRLQTIDFDLVRGDDFAMTLAFKDIDGSTLDVSGWSFLGQVRADPDTPTVLAEFAFDTTNAISGIVVCSLAASDTADFFGRFVCYDIQLTTDMGFVRTAPRGRLNVFKDVTRG